MRSDTMFARATRTFSLLITAFGCLLGASAAHAADAPFTPRFAQTLHGGIQAVGNTLMTCPKAAANCAAARARTATGGALNNNSYTMGFVDVDGDATTA